MSNDWLRAEPLWFGVHLAPEHGFLPETKKSRRDRTQHASRPAGTSDDPTSGGADDGRKRRRSVSAERRRKALERRKKAGDDSNDD